MDRMRDLAKVSATCDNAMQIADDVIKVVEILRECGEPMRCKDISPIMKSQGYHSSIAHITKMLGFAKSMGIVTRTEIECEPIEIEVDEWVYEPDDNKPMTIEVDGITYERVDRYKSRGHWGTVKKTIVPKIALYSMA